MMRCLPLVALSLVGSAEAFAFTVTTSSPQLPKASPGDLAPGSYRITSFAVPFTFTTESDWILDKSRPGLFDLITMK